MVEIITKFLQNEGITEFAFLPRERLRAIQGKTLPEEMGGAVVFLMPYHVEDEQTRNVSRYAVARDYHGYFKALSLRFGAMMKKRFPACYVRSFCDASPLDEVSSAVEGGLGMRGDNRLVINRTYGSYIFVGSFLLGEAHTKMGSETEKECLHCGACKRACGYLRGEESVCLSALTQQKRVTDEELARIAALPLVWGCDTCQEACPFNKTAKTTPIAYFKSHRTPYITYEDIDGMPDEIFRERAYAWRGKDVVLRNLHLQGHKER